MGGYPTPEALREAVVARTQKPVRFPRTKGQKSDYALLADAIMLGPKKALEGYRPQSLAPCPPKPSKPSKEKARSQL